ncbi:DUF4271 domain-containing protein [Marinilabilia rubra]|nr:DUF4271 domain-containing protein [Marinilabilia rubra]
MSTKASSLYIPLFQNQDSTLQVLPGPVDVPQKIEIKVKRPTIKQQLEVPQDTASEQTVAPVANPRPKVVQQVDEEPDKPVVDPSLPDTLDHVLVQDWANSGFKKSLWTSAANDSVCLLSPGHFEESHQEETGKVMLTVTDDEVGDSIALGGKTVDRVEEIRIKDPDLVTKAKYDAPLLSQNWFLFVLVGLVAITGIVRFRWQKYLSDVFSAVVFSNVANKLQSDTSVNKRLASFWLGFLFYANFSLLLFETMRISERTFFNLQGFQLLIGLAGFLVVIFTLKFVVYKFVGWVFRVQEPTGEYLFQSSVMSKAFGVILMPLVTIFAFLEPEARIWIPRIGLSAFILLYVIQIGRGIVANLRNTLSGYYIILYLCALEILPLSILYKVLFY